MHTLVVVVVMSEVDSRLRLETETPTSYMLHVSVSVSKSKLTSYMYVLLSCIMYHKMCMHVVSYVLQCDYDHTRSERRRRDAVD